MLSLNNLVLRPMGENDLEMVLKWRNSPEIRHNMLSNITIAWEEHIEWFKRNLNTDKSELFVVEYKGRAIGVVNITDISRKDKTCSWGMYIGDDQRNFGLGILMNIRAIDRMVNSHGIRKIWGHVLGDNRILLLHERFGFKQEGVLKSHIERNGIFEDVTLVGFFTDKWQENRKKLIQALRIRE